MKFIRIFWGDLEVFDSKFKTQITEASKHIEDNEIVLVWGEGNEEYLKSLGYETFLIDTKPWNEEYGIGHHMFNHTSLLHKLYAFNLAVETFKEVLFIDWDCYKIRKFDDTFYSHLIHGGPLQVPLYIYPYEVIRDLQQKNSQPDYIVSFFSKLEYFLNKYSYESSLGYIIPNTGFMYCRDSKISKSLLEKAIDNKLQTVPDEFAVMVYALDKQYDLYDYIRYIEPNVTFGKHQISEGEDYWEAAQEHINSLTSQIIEKDIYFHHV